MKRSKSSQPVVQYNETVTSQRSLRNENDKNKHLKQKPSTARVKLEDILLDAEESYEKDEYESALLKFSQGASINPKNEAFALGVRKSKIAILNDFKSIGDNVLLKEELETREKKNFVENLSDFDSKSFALQKALQKINIHPKGSARSDTSDVNFFKSEIVRGIHTNLKQKSTEQLYNLKIHDGKKYKIVSATAEELREYIKDKDYFKMKEQNDKEWKKLRSEMNKKIAEKEAMERYEKEAKLLEERSNIRQYCDEQVTLIGRYFQNGKIADVVRFSENFIKYLNKKPDKLLPRKWIYLATAFNYLGRAYIEQENFEKAKAFGEKLYKVAISSANPELIAQSYILSGKIYVKFGKYEEAAFVWEKLIPLIENNEKKAWLYHEIGRCYFELGQFDTAYKHGVESVIWAEKCSSSKWLSSANVLQGQCEMKRNNFASALEKFEEAKKHAEATNDESTLKYIASIEEILNVALSKKRMASNLNSNDDEQS